MGDKWVQAEIQEKTGPVSYKCLSNNGQVVRRHLDQLIERDSNVSVHSDPELDSTEVPQNSTQNKSPVVTPPVVIRRSGRVTRPVDRLNL